MGIRVIHGMVEAVERENVRENVATLRLLRIIDESGETTTLLGVRAPIAIASTLVSGVTHELFENPGRKPGSECTFLTAFG